LALIFLVRTKAAFGALVRNPFVVLAVTEWKVISPTAFFLAGAVGRTESLRVAIARELIGAFLETVVGDIAGTACVDGTSVDELAQGENKECEREKEHDGCRDVSQGQ
jgi:hypothetical protein